MSPYYVFAGVVLVGIVIMAVRMSRRPKGQTGLGLNDVPPPRKRPS